MQKHNLDKHNGIRGSENGLFDFKMEALIRCKKSLTRIVGEAVRIKEIDGDPKVEMLNSIIEYYGA